MTGFLSNLGESVVANWLGTTFSLSGDLGVSVKLPSTADTPFSPCSGFGVSIMLSRCLDVSVLPSSDSGGGPLEMVGVPVRPLEVMVSAPWGVLKLEVGAIVGSLVMLLILTLDARAAR